MTPATSEFAIGQTVYVLDDCKDSIKPWVVKRESKGCYFFQKASSIWPTQSRFIFKTEIEAFQAMLNRSTSRLSRCAKDMNDAIKKHARIVERIKAKEIV